MSEKSLGWIFLMIFVLTGCLKDPIPIDMENLIVGNWEFVVSSEEPLYTLYHLKRVAVFPEKYGSVSFSADGNFSYRGAWGFTGQPTLFTGTWRAGNDTLVFVNMARPFEETWNMAIKIVDKENLEYYFLYNR